MSSGQIPRNPRYFPKMKVRGARRRAHAKWERAARVFDMAAAAFRRLSDSVGETVVTWQRVEALTLASRAAEAEREEWVSEVTR